ncbi:MAG: hypothetical protein AAF685_12850 [Cyanobacteria bacterium P01_C01_bin.89]
MSTVSGRGAFDGRTNPDGQLSQALHQRLLSQHLNGRQSNDLLHGGQFSQNCLASGQNFTISNEKPRGGFSDDSFETPNGDSCRLVVDQSQVGGLIVCYEFYAEFIGPGAIAYSPAEAPYTQIFALGSPLLLPLADSIATANAYRQRSHWVTWLGRIAGMQEPVDRCRRLLQGLEGLFSPSAVKEVPDSALAMLVGVLPTTMAQVRREYRKKVLIPVNPKPREKSYYIQSGIQSGVRGGEDEAAGDRCREGTGNMPHRHQNQLPVTGVLHVNAKDRFFRVIA